jgi:hypothetical protein
MPSSGRRQLPTDSSNPLTIRRGDALLVDFEPTLEHVQEFLTKHTISKSVVLIRMSKIRDYAKTVSLVSAKAPLLRPDYIIICSTFA